MYLKKKSDEHLPTFYTPKYFIILIKNLLELIITPLTHPFWWLNWTPAFNYDDLEKRSSLKITGL